MVSFVEFMQILEGRFDLHCEETKSVLNYKILLPQGTQIKVYCDEAQGHYGVETLPLSVPSNMDWSFFVSKVMEFNRHSLQKINAGIFLMEEERQFFLRWRAPQFSFEESQWHEYFLLFEALAVSMQTLFSEQYSSHHLITQHDLL